VSERHELLHEFVCGVRQGFVALEHLGVAPPPVSLRTIFCYTPESFARWYWSRLFRGPRARAYFEMHIRHAPQEGRALAHDLFGTFPDLELRAPIFARLVAPIRL
jgi:hypothetical protein